MAANREPPQSQLARGLRAGNLKLIRAAAGQLDPLPPGVAFEVLMLIARREPDLWGRASARWLGRVALEHRSVELADLAALSDALLARDDGAREQLRQLDRRLNIGLDHGLALWPRQR